MSGQKSFQFGYQNRSGADWKPTSPTAVRYEEGEPVMSHRSPSGGRKPIAAKPMSKSEFESYQASGAMRGGRYVDGKWKYDAAETTAAAISGKLPALIDTGSSAVAATAS